MSQWYLEPILNSYVAVAASVFILASLLIVSPRFKGLSSGKRRTLVILRLTLILLLLLGLLRPTYISTTDEPQSATLIVLFDQSRSLGVADMAGGKTRWQSMRETLVDAAPLFADLAETYELQVYGYDAKPTPSEVSPMGTIKLPEEPSGVQTDIGQALHDAVNRQIGKRIAGVVLLGDGAQRAHRPNVDLQHAARDLARLGYPLYTVTYGRPRDQSQARDVAVQNLLDQYSVFVRNELLVRGTVAISGYANQPIPITMIVESPSGDRVTVDDEILTATENNQQVRFELTFTPNEPGQHKLTVIAADQPGELVTDNNQLSAYVNALDGGMRVLLLHSNPLHGEVSILARSIGSSPDIQLDKRFVDMRDTSGQTINLSRELDTEYDVYLFCDVDSSRIGEEQATAIVDKIAAGKGFMMTGGFHSFGAGGYGVSPLGKVIPVEMSRFDRQEIGLDAPIRKDLHFDKPMLMIPTRDHFITRLGSVEENESVWRQLRPLRGANQFSKVQQRATVLAVANDQKNGEPLLVGWTYGDGRVLAFAGDTTHYWWRHGHQVEHKRFWRQSMLWLSQKDASQNQDVWIQLEKRRYLPGETIRFTAGARGVDGDPIDQAQLKAELQLGESETQSIGLTPENGAWTGAWDELLDPGEYQIAVSARFENQVIGETSGKFVVLKQDLELTDPAANPQRMQMLASMTPGGRSVPPEQFTDLLNEIKSKPPETHVEVQSKRQLGDTAVSAWTFVLVFVFLVTTEWFLRKRWGMV